MILGSFGEILCPPVAFDYYYSLFPQFLFELLTRRLFPLAAHAGSCSFQAAHGPE